MDQFIIYPSIQFGPPIKSQYNKPHPTITSVSFENITSNIGVFHWITDKNTTSSVTYCESGKSTCEFIEDNNLGTEHEVRITNFNPNAAYDIGIISTDAEGNQTDLKLYNYLTKLSSKEELTKESTKPLISSVVLDAKIRTINWRTDKPAECQFKLLSNPSSKFIVSSDPQTTNHTILFGPSVLSNKIYDYIIIATDLSGNIGEPYFGNFQLK